MSTIKFEGFGAKDQIKHCLPSEKPLRVWQGYTPRNKEEIKANGGGVRGSEQAPSLND